MTCWLSGERLLPFGLLVSLLVGKMETNIHLEQPFYLLTKTWKYGGSVLGTEVAGRAQSKV